MVKLKFHRKEQFDLEVLKPILVVHLSTPNRSTRLLCLWRNGLQFGKRTFLFNKEQNK